ncbi:hypothetical protein [Piscinibacter terrae]|uniref:Uncharacterized protein n=1 Tax=Piscinibacter terrae TaxID=2496871 RepID=A0A3N7HKC5_9BURK|nr:hypothetical protein [Albitalea terrae]RQP21436.1 hypothetical protein DZC73_28590 [Albitalea terrae]
MNDHPPAQFSEVDWTAYSAVDIAYEVAQYRFEREYKLLRVRFAGDYGCGAGGNGDATYMDAMYRAAVEIIDPDGLILDFSDLNYKWGDLLGKVLNVPDCLAQRGRPPFAIVVAKGCEKAVLSLLTEDLGWSENELAWVFRDLLSAQRYVEQIMREHGLATSRELEVRKRDQALAFWELLGPEVGPEECRNAECHRLRVRDSVLCRVHHYEQIQREPCPFK